MVMSKNDLLKDIEKLETEVSENFPHYDLIRKDDVLRLIEGVGENSTFYGIDTKLWNEVVAPSLSLYFKSSKDKFRACIILRGDVFTSELPNIYKERYGGKLVLSSSYISLSCDNGDTYWFISGSKLDSYMRGLRFNQIILAQ